MILHRRRSIMIMMNITKKRSSNSSIAQYPPCVPVMHTNLVPSYMSAKLGDQPSVITYLGAVTLLSKNHVLAKRLITRPLHPKPQLTTILLTLTDSLMIVKGFCTSFMSSQLEILLNAQYQPTSTNTQKMLRHVNNRENTFTTMIEDRKKQIRYISAFLPLKCTPSY